MAAINDLINQIQDSELRDRIQKEVNKMAKQKKFGLVFEEHVPECTPLYDMPIKRGCKVMLRDKKDDKTIYVVLKLEDNVAICARRDNCEELCSFLLRDIVRIAEFGEPIYPYLKTVDIISTAPKSDLWHALIEADNYHALQLLEYLYSGKVDCIYIDPPYNTGAKDWKYNNDYVDSSDVYQHSKWLSFMKKRLTIAKRLLNPKTGILILTIDEHEVHHIRCLLEEIFTEFYIQMITCVTNPTGASQGRFSRIEEYAIYCFAPEAFVSSFDDPMIGEIATTKEVRWKSLLRSGPSSRREDRKNMFYPVYVDPKAGMVVRAGDSLPFEEKPCFDAIDGLEVAWPIRTDNSQGRWGVGADTLNSLIKKGYVQLGRFDPKRKTYGITYLSAETQKMIETGEVKIVGQDSRTGVVKVAYAKGHTQAVRTVWQRTRHNAGVYGTNMLSSILGKDRKFPFPKSLYMTKDSIATVMKDRPNALIVDFFAGSGTTLHAVNLLNKEDGGNRRCILVTNNEVSVDEAKRLRTKGINPGEKEWNELGIARHITWPRTVCSILGKDINGDPLKGQYIDSDFSIAEGFESNVAFFQLGFLDKTSVALGLNVQEMLSIFWLKTGAIGPCPVVEQYSLNDMIILPQNGFAVLINEASFSRFKNEIEQSPEIQTVFISTDYDANYRAMVKDLNVKTTYQLFGDYLNHFRLNRGRN